MALLLNIPLDDADEAVLVRITNERNSDPGVPGAPLTPNNVAARHVRFWLRSAEAKFRAADAPIGADDAYQRATLEQQAEMKALVDRINVGVPSE
jgi:hypothetical protein